jgi:hypothetical protein
MAEPNIHDYPWLTEATGIDVNSLGCVMLPVGFLRGMLQGGYDEGAFSEDDLYFANDPKLFWIKGDVSAKAHVTLLYGLLKPAYDPEQAELIQRLIPDNPKFDGFPSWLPIEGFEIFPSNIPTEDYAVIVARIGDPDGILGQAHALLSYLPHVDTFAQWKLHATIAYVKSEVAGAWIDYLSAAVPASMVVVPDAPLDLGSEK